MGILNLEGKVVFITGGSREIGHAIAKAIALEKGIVIIGYLNRGKEAEDILEDVVKSGGNGMVCRIDVTKGNEVKEVISRIIDRFGRIDILINNARYEIKRIKFSEMKWEDIQEQMDVIVKGVFNCCKEIVVHMKERQQGRIINILSDMIHDPVTGYINYITPLSAIVGFSRCLALEVGEFGIAINNILPGFTETSETPYAPDYVKKKIIEDTPLKRLATPEDIANGVLFYASDLSKHITGGNMIMDGGKLMV